MGTLCLLDTPEMLWEHAKDQLTAEELSCKLLLAKDIWGRTAWHVAAEKDKPKVLDIIM